MIYLDLEPNWSSGLTENLDFMTDVFTSRSGKEKREALRSTARRSLSFTYDTFGPNAWRNIVDKINAAIIKAASAPKVRDRFVASGFEPTAPMSSAQLAQSVKEEFDRNAAIVKQFDIKLSQ